MSTNKKTGVYQLENGYWGYRYTITINEKKKDVKRTKDEFGNVLKTEKAAIRAREASIKREYETRTIKPKPKRMTVAEIYDAYCKTGRYDKAYGTIKKQDSLWKNHINPKFGKRFVDDISVAEVNDYLAFLYYEECKSYKYVESFLKMFYLIFGQAYSKNYIDVDAYNTLCVNKNSKIHMPKMKIDEDTDIRSFSKTELQILDKYFTNTNAETAYMLGRYCGLRINECYGLKWSDIDFENDSINIERQMQYQNGLIKLVPLKTRNAKRKVYMSNTLKKYLLALKEATETAAVDIPEQRQQKQTFITDTNGNKVGSLCLVNTLSNGKLQTVNSMKYHSRTLKNQFKIDFKYHYLRHTFGTMLAELNTPAHILCNQMGHGSSQVTQKYYLAISENGIDILKDKVNQL